MDVFKMQQVFRDGSYIVTVNANEEFVTGVIVTGNAPENVLQICDYFRSVNAKPRRALDAIRSEMEKHGNIVRITP